MLLLLISRIQRDQIRCGGSKNLLYHSHVDHQNRNIILWSQSGESICVFFVCTRNIFELNDGKWFDKLLNNSCISNKRNLVQGKFSINFWTTSLESPYTLSLQTPICKAKTSIMIKAWYSGSLLEYVNLSSKDKGTLMPSWSYKTTHAQPPRWLDQP